MSTFQDAIQRGDRASQPLASAVIVGAIYYVTDEGVTERSTGSAWEDISDAGTLADGAVTNAKLANMAQSTIKGRASGAGAGAPTDLTATQATAILDVVVGDSGSGGTKGLVPAPAAGDAAAGKFLKADGTFAVPAGSASGDVTGPASSTDNAIPRFDGTGGKTLQDSGITIADGATGTLAGSNSGDVTLAGTPDYITIAGQVLTRGQVDLAADVTGTLPSANLPTAIKTSTIGIAIDGAGAAITTGVKGYLEVPFAGTITAVRLFADQSGSAVVDIWKDSYANFPPTVADTITASAKPTLSSAQASEDTTLAGWTTSISAGDILAFNVDSASTITRLTLQLTVTR